MTGQAEVQPVPNARELRMVIDLFCVQRDTREETKCLIEIRELQGANQGIAALIQLPPYRCVHGDSPVKSPVSAYAAAIRPCHRSKVTKWRKWKGPPRPPPLVTVAGLEML